MKNIHILPTEKPSMLHLAFGSTFIVSTEPTLSNNLYASIPQNIYITSDEEIKERDWCYASDGKQILQFNNRVGVLLANQQKEKYGLKSFFKIILTTDLDLIKDGVQAIDDEFLEWFVNNPSCEFVKVQTMYFDKVFYKIIIPKPIQQIIDEDFDGGLTMGQIIPQEETKQENCCTPIGQIKRYLNCVGCDRKPKQETLEEAFEKWSDEVKGYTKYDVLRFGAKWMQKQMYSEEEVLEHLNHLIMMPSSELDEFTNDEEMVTMKWFEQFKNK